MHPNTEVHHALKKNYFFLDFLFSLWQDDIFLPNVEGYDCVTLLKIIEVGARDMPNALAVFLKRPSSDK